MDSKGALIAFVATAHDDLREIVDALTEAEMAEAVMDDWTRKDVVAHIGWWEGHSADLIEALRAGREPHERVSGAIDEINERVYREHLADTPDAARRFEAAEYARLVGALEGASEEDLFDATRFPWTEGEPLLATIRADTSLHYEEHLEHLRAARG
ncbi:MAG: ClbS/DfsB family four-helix bundle protein [Chloroflexota bacterium]